MTPDDLLWQAQVIKHGKRLGYPSCCITEFAKLTPRVLARLKPTREMIRRYLASMYEGGYSGFIPCANHAEMILSGEIKLHELIKDRDASLQPFPKDWTLK